MNFTTIFSIIIFTVIASGCEKQDIAWNLRKNNSFDVRLNTPCQINDCNSLNNINTFVDKISPSSSASWDIGTGKKGNGFTLTQPCYGGYIEFFVSLNSKAKMTFWTKSLNSGYSNIIPEVTIDGILNNPVLIDGSEAYNNWMQLETPVFNPEPHTIRINFPHRSTYYQYYIDEIEFWCE